MNLEDYRTVFAAGCLVLMLIAAAPTLGLIVPFPSGGERFSEFWVLGPNRMAEDYPFNVRANESYSVFVGVGNHMGVSLYYLVYVKFRNQTQPIPSATSSEPSSLAPLYEFRAFVRDAGDWEARVTFGFSNVSLYGDSVSVNLVTINGEAFTVDAFSKWDSERSGFYYQLFFELWLYDQASRSFIFDNRFVSTWLNVTT